MKKLVLTVFCALIAFALHAQVSDNFSAYTVGGKIAQQAQTMGRDYWTTWSDDPGSDEDGVIAEIDGNKCGHWTYDNDQILLLGEKTTGIWELSFKMYVPANKRGYFNILAHFDGANPNNCEWALEVYFYKSNANQGTPTNPGVGSINAGAKEVKTFDYTEDAWTDVKVVIDLDDDDAQLFINNTLLHQWQYTKGALGEGCPAKIHALDMFPPDAISEFYLDDIVFKASNNELLYSTGFDDVANGSYVAQSYPTWWTTWGNQPATPQDALITNEQASSSPNSAKCTYVAGDNGTDLVFKAGDQTEGTYTVDFDMYIPANGIAFFNLLHVFDGNNSEWAIGVYFNVSAGAAGTGMPAGSYVQQNNAITNFDFPFATWFPISVYVNVDDDLANIKINGTQVLEWQFSLKESGGVGVNKLAAVDFYPIETGSVFYIDNFVYAKEGEVKPPPVISIAPEELVIKLQPNSTKSGDFHIYNEEEGTLKARWSTYIDYAPLETGTGPNFTLSLCDPNEEPTGGIGSSGAVDRELAMKLTPADYVNQLGGELKQVGFFIKDDYPAQEQYFKPASDLTFRVYAQGPAENVPGEILAEKVLPMANFALEAWNFVDIDPVQLTGGEYWVSVAMFQNADSYPMTHTSDALKYNGDWLKTGANGSWGKLSDGSTIQNNWAIVAKGSGKVQKVWGLMDQAYGTTLSASQSDVTVTVNSENVPNGTTMTANIVILTNDPEHLRFDLPLIMNVTDSTESSNANAKEVIVNDVVATLQTSGTEFRVTVPCAEEILIVVIPEDENATVTGDTGTFEVTCFTSNSYTFTVTAEDGVTTKDYKLTVLVEKGIGISELNNSVKLFPNPVTDYLHIESEFAIEYITIYDLTGRMVKQIRQSATSIDMSDLATGFYLMKITTDQGEAMHKFVKQ